MDFINGTQRLMAMSDAAWARHASPLSVYTRIPILPLMVLAVWSRVWLGWWALVPVAVMAAWTWINPRIFPAPRRLDGWSSKMVLGERVFLDRSLTIPGGHRRAGILLSIANSCGLPFVIWGLIVLDPWMTAFGTVVSFICKLWFCDRMVWLYDIMRAADPAVVMRYENASVP